MLPALELPEEVLNPELLIVESRVELDPQAASRAPAIINGNKFNFFIIISLYSHGGSKQEACHGTALCAWPR
jgi:hypothetical protein